MLKREDLTVSHIGSRSGSTNRLAYKIFVVGKFFLNERCTLESSKVYRLILFWKQTRQMQDARTDHNSPYQQKRSLLSPQVSVPPSKLSEIDIALTRH
jgi:hypothetical protein